MRVLNGAVKFFNSLSEDLCLLHFPNPFQGARVFCALSETQQTVQNQTKPKTAMI